MRSALIIVIAAGITSVLAAIIVGTRTFEGTVVQDPYESGLRWDAERHSRDESGLNVSIGPETVRVGPADIHVDLRDRQGRPVRKAEVTLRLGLLQTDRLDREYRFTEAPGGGYRSKIAVPEPGRWKADISVTVQGRAAHFSRSLHVVASP